MGEDKHWAQSYLIDPLIAPDPSDETGPGSHFRSTFAPASSFTPTPPASAVPHDDDDKASSIVSSSVGISNQPTGSTVSTNPFRRSGAGYPTPPNSVSPRKDRFPSSSHRAEAFGGYNEGRPLSSGAQPSSETLTGRPRRTSSLKARFAGDESHRPLDIIRRDSKRAHNSPHLKKKHMPAADLIDRLDVHAYHHEGPYDAVLAVRNTSLDISPLAAVADSNREALKATPKENVMDSLQRHRPLEGTAMVPPGVPDGLGRVYDYEEGTDMMRDLGGNYKRWDHVPYHPDDLKGKGEPSYTIEKALKEHDATNGQGIELKSRSRNKSMGHADRQTAGVPEDNYLSPGNGGGVMRRNTTGKRVAEGLKRTFGSLRRKKASS